MLNRETEKDQKEAKINLVPENGVRYTVPSEIRTGHMAEEQLIRFRVDDVYKNCYIRAYLDGEQIFFRKRQMAAPGKMEQIKLKKDKLLAVLEGKIGCPMGCAIVVEMKGKEVASIEGNTCKKGAEYAAKEVTDPTRIVTTTVRVKNGSMTVVSVKTAQDIPKGMIFDCVKALRDVCVDAPVRIGDIILRDTAGTGVDIVATGNVQQT